MDPLRIQLVHRQENKSTLMEPRMRNSQPWFFDDALAVKEDVKIDRARPRSIIIVPPESAFDLLQRREKATWLNICF
jgi:hypothetical protein